MTIDKDAIEPETGQIGKLIQETFAITFSIDLSGYVNIYIDWPNEDNRPAMRQPISDLIFSIDSGGMKGLIAEALTNTTTQRPELKDYITSIIIKWAEIQNKSNESPVIKPRNTFMK